MATGDDDMIKRAVYARKSDSEDPVAPPTPKPREHTLSEAQIAFSKSQNQRFLAPTNRVIRYRRHEDMTRDMEEWVVKTLVDVQRRRHGSRISEEKDP